MKVKAAAKRPQSVVEVGSVRLGNNLPLTAIGGCCAIESEEITMRLAGGLKRIFEKSSVDFIFKISFDKANRSSAGSWRGLGIEKGIKIIGDVKEKFGFPVLTDIHEPWQAEQASRVADILQIPAFLCRQTDLLFAAADTGKAVNIKKGQFMSPWESAHAAEKVISRGNRRIMLTERGYMFGYNNLVVDMRSLEIMKGFGFPVIFDATHSQQMPGGLGRETGGAAEFIAPLARAAAAVGLAGIFFEAHPDPKQAKSDRANTLALNEVAGFWKNLAMIDKVVKNENFTR